MPRAIWKGAISFGLRHIPVALYPASEESEIDFDWIDESSNDPVGYKRANKRTGGEISREDIVRGVNHRGGKCVLLSDEEIKAAFPKTTQTIEIGGFVRATRDPAPVPRARVLSRRIPRRWPPSQAMEPTSTECYERWAG